VRAARVKPPLEDVPLDHQGARQLTVAIALRLGPDVDNQAVIFRHTRQVFRPDAPEAVPGPLQNIVDRGALTWIRDRSR
jgi:hypothetical protein